MVFFCLAGQAVRFETKISMSYSLPSAKIRNYWDYRAYDVCRWSYATRQRRRHNRSTEGLASRAFGVGRVSSGNRRKRNVRAKRGTEFVRIGGDHIFMADTPLS